jgi:RNA polymerase sigma-70 factor (ECF subfamily)
MSALFRAKPADFDQIYHRHAPSVYRYALAVLGNHSDAEDVTQQTFLNAYRAIEQGTKPRKTENWLVTIAHNEVRRHFRRRGNTVEVQFDERLAHPVPEDSGPSLADVLRALQHLPPAQRSALVMREFEGRSYAEIAELLDVTQSALETLIFRARRALAEHLEGAITCTEAEQAFSRRLDGRLPRREARRLRAHLKECSLCERFAASQRRQRSLLKGLSMMPIPVPFFRGEPAAVLGLAGSAPLAGGGAAAAGAGASGLAAGLVAKAAAVTAAAVARAAWLRRRHQPRHQHGGRGPYRPGGCSCPASRRRRAERRGCYTACGLLSAQHPPTVEASEGQAARPEGDAGRAEKRELKATPRPSLRDRQEGGGRREDSRGEGEAIPR